MVGSQAAWTGIQLKMTQSNYEGAATLVFEIEEDVVERLKGIAYNRYTPDDCSASNNVNGDAGLDFEQPPVESQDGELDRRDAQGVEYIAGVNVLQESRDLLWILYFIDVQTQRLAHA